MQQAAVFLHAVKKPFICISYMVELNDAGRGVHVGYSNYETVEKNVKRRLS